MGPNRKSVDEETLKKRVTLHESGHVMGVEHTGRVMDFVSNLFDSSAVNFFSNSQLGRVQGQPFPKSRPDPTIP